MLKFILLGLLGLILLIPLISSFSSRLYWVEAEREIRATPKQVWKIIAEDFGSIYQYTPSVEQSNYIGDQREDVGTQRHCKLQGGGFMQEEITAWEALRTLEISIKDSSMPVAKGTKLRFHLEETPGGNTRLQAKGYYRLKYIGVLSPLLGKPKFMGLTEHLLEIAKVEAEANTASIQ
ncbi:MAG: SRPBCC family protein [Saprospiraceae bacterium]|nr:SRPBCC family protein [Saprospiraceae bacterium]